MCARVCVCACAYACAACACVCVRVPCTVYVCLHVHVYVCVCARGGASHTLCVCVFSCFTGWLWECAQQRLRRPFELIVVPGKMFALSMSSAWHSKQHVLAGMTLIFKDVLSGFSTDRFSCQFYCVWRHAMSTGQDCSCCWDRLSPEMAQVWGDHTSLRIKRHWLVACKPAESPAQFSGDLRRLSRGRVVIDWTDDFGLPQAWQSLLTPLTRKSRQNSQVLASMKRGVGSLSCSGETWCSHWMSIDGYGNYLTKSGWNEAFMIRLPNIAVLGRKHSTLAQNRQS